jgi:hypothetical protein
VVAYLALAAGYFLFILQGLHPWLFPGRLNLFTQNWAYGHSTGDVAAYFATHPVATLAKLNSGGPVRLAQTVIWLPILAGWRVLPMLGVLCLWVNSTNSGYNSLAFYYSLPSVILCFLAMPFSFRSLGRIFSSTLVSRHRQVAALTACGIILAMVGAARTKGEHPEIVSWGVSGRANYILGKVRQFPGFSERDKTILASFGMAAYVPPRPGLDLTFVAWQRFVHGTLRPDYVVIDQSVEHFAFPMADRQALVDAVRASTAYERVFDDDGFLLYAKRAY